MKIHLTLTAEKSGNICDLLASETGISKMKIKDALQKGALSFKGKKDRKRRRLRRAKASVNPGDSIEFSYDDEILSLAPPLPELICDKGAYSVWMKPAGLMSQGTKYGDHCSILRQAELFFSSQRKVYPVHRLDREAEGVMVIAHTPEAASKLSALFQEGKVDKTYEASVMGHPSPEKGTIEKPLDGKPAISNYEVLTHDPETGISSVRVKIKTGRYHQIRRHLDMIGHPIVGDSRYGKGNKNRDGLKLKAVSLGFRCPFSGKEVRFGISNQ